MNTAINATIYIIWGLGAALVIMFLLFWIAAMSAFALKRWRKGLDEVHLHMWVWQALVAYEKAGHRRPDQGSTMSAERNLQMTAHALIDLARAEGFVVTIETAPLTPLAMGRYAMVADVREARHKYSKPPAP